MNQFKNILVNINVNISMLLFSLKELDHRNIQLIRIIRIYYGTITNKNLMHLLLNRNAILFLVFIFVSNKTHKSVPDFHWCREKSGLYKCPKRSTSSRCTISNNSLHYQPFTICVSAFEHHLPIIIMSNNLYRGNAS